MSRLRTLALALVLGAPLGARAIDAPHEAGTNCSSCHLGHNAPGGALTKTAGNASLCQSCHVSETGFGFPWSDADQAVPGASGRSHHWSAPATGLGATAPLAGTPMGDRLDAGNLTCSTCHDQHNNLASLNGGTQHATVITKTGSVGTGALTFATGSPAASAAARFYRVEIVAAGSEATARFRLSHDKGTSWFGCSGPGVYVAYVASPSNACAAGASVALDDGANVTVAFGTGTYVVGERWDFYVSYPFLRIANVDAAMCVECHRDRNMTWQNADGTGPIVGTGASIVFGTTTFSHPVGQALNQGGRTNGLPGGILDANGMVQATSTDPNKTNDLQLGTGGVVTCLSCHHPHNADSNSLSVDPR